MKLSFTGPAYYLILIFVVILTIIVLIVMNKHKDKGNKVVIFLMIFNLVIHVLKVFLPPYINNLPQSLLSMTFENICATTVLLALLLYKSKNKYLMDAVVFLSILGGLSTVIYPIDAFTIEITSFPIFLSVVRIYVTHYFMFLSALLILFCKIHTLSYRRSYLIVVYFFAVAIIIFANESLIFVFDHGKDATYRFLSSQERNSGFVFGPTPSLSKIPFVDFFIPDIFKYHIPNRDEVFYYPIIWELLPAICFILPLGYLITFLDRFFLDRKVKTKQ